MSVLFIFRYLFNDNWSIIIIFGFRVNTTKLLNG